MWGDGFDDGSNPDQGTAEWGSARAGCITASRMGDLIWEPGQRYKSGDKIGKLKPPPLSRTGYIDQLVAEVLTGCAKESVTAKSLEYGMAMEPEAIAVYEQRTGRMVEQCGFVRHRNYDFIGASADLLVDEDGGGEVKCPMSIVVHATTLREGLPDEHIEQIQGNLWVSDRKWWDFISYNPKFPPGLDLYVQRVQRDDKHIANMRACCLSAWDEVQSIVAQLRKRITQPQGE